MLFISSRPQCVRVFIDAVQIALIPCFDEAYLPEDVTCVYWFTTLLPRDLRPPVARTRPPMPKGLLKDRQTSCHDNTFRITGPKFQCHDDVIKWKHFQRCWPFVREYTGHRWMPPTKASDAELWCFLWYKPEPTVEQTVDTPVIWDAIVLIMTSL